MPKPNWILLDGYNLLHASGVFRSYRANFSRSLPRGAPGLAKVTRSATLNASARRLSSMLVTLRPACRGPQPNTASASNLLPVVQKQTMFWKR